MKIAFIYPGYENLGIEYLSAALKKNGHTTYLILDPVLFADSGGINIPLLEKYFNYSKKILRELSWIKPNLICFSCVSDNFLWALRLSNSIKKYFNIPIIFGGIHPTSVPDIVIKHECVDFVTVGEGEEALLEVVQGIENGARDYPFKNIWYKNNGSVIANELRPLLADLDILPFPDKALYYKKYKFMFKGYTIITSRGCPHSCSYCANSLLRGIYNDKGPYLRRRSVENVVEELEKAKETYQPRFIHFCDEVFTHDKNWLSKFIVLYKRKIKLPFACYTSPRYINEEEVQLLKEGGCYKIQMGVQTLDKRKRELVLNRHYTNEQISQAIEIIRRNKIYLTCDNIFGLPGQDRQELIKMAEFYANNKPNHIEVFWLRYYPQTRIVSIAEDMGLVNAIMRERIEGGHNNRGIARGGDTYSLEFAQFQMLLNLFHFMPRFLRSLVIKKRMYKFLPKLDPVFITILFRLFNRAKYDMYTSVTFMRYLHFMMRTLLRFTSF